jgi:hypothetical protein
MIIRHFCTWIRKNGLDQIRTIIPDFCIVHMQKSGIISSVWAQSFFLVHMQESWIINSVWSKPFFVVHIQKSGIIGRMAETNPVWLSLISSYGQGRMT